MCWDFAGDGPEEPGGSVPADGAHMVAVSPGPARGPARRATPRLVTPESWRASSLGQPGSPGSWPTGIQGDSPRKEAYTTVTDFHELGREPAHLL